MMPGKKNIFRLILIAAGIAAVLALLEAGLRIYYCATDESKYYVWPPNMRTVFRPSPGLLPGVTRSARFIVNSDGLRGDERSPDHQLRILTIGGSTTECAFLDQEVSWPYLFQTRLSAAWKMRVWVGNAGKAGLVMREHYLHMKYLLPQHPDADVVIILAGANDLLRRLGEDKNFIPPYLERYEAIDPLLVRRAFSVVPYEIMRHGPGGGIFDGLMSVRLFHHLKYLYERRSMVQDEAGDIYRRMRSLRAARRETIDRLPDMESALEKYRQDINDIVDIARKMRVRLIFITQPSIWKERMPEEEEGLLWLGWIDRPESGRYYSTGALMRGMRLFNDELMRVSGSRGVECIDLAPLLQKDASIFYDDLHLNEKGAIKAAEILSKRFKRSTPFR